MARNGTGTYSLPAGNPVVTGTAISSTWANTTLSDIGTALSQSLSQDGQTPVTANLPMGGFKLTGLAAGTTAGDSVRYEQFGAPPAIGNVTPTTGAFTQITSTVATGTPPLVVASTTEVANLKAATATLATTATTATDTASKTGTGSVYVTNTSPTLVTPALGTPSALVGTNITGTAAALSIGGNAATATTATTVSDGAITGAKLTVSGAGDYLSMPKVLDKASGAATTSPQKVLECRVGRAGALRTITKHAFASVNLAGDRHCAIYKNGVLVVDNTVAINSNEGFTVTSYFSNDTGSWVTNDLLQVYIWTDNASDLNPATCGQLVLEAFPLVNSAAYTYYYTAGAW
jgi:hypothetical protein